MDMHVYADGGEVESDCDGEVRRLSSDPRQLAQLLDRVRQHAAELLSVGPPARTAPQRSARSPSARRGARAGRLPL